jgi:hypothetical protein
MKQKFELINPAGLDSADQLAWLSLQVWNGLKYHDGITIGLSFDRPKVGYSVSIYPEHGRTYKGLPSQTDVINFIESHRELLSRPIHYIGGWRADGISYLDISVIYDNKDAAIELAARFDQQAIYNLETGETIYINQ